MKKKSKKKKCTLGEFLLFLFCASFFISVTCGMISSFVEDNETVYWLDLIFDNFVSFVLLIVMSLGLLATIFNRKQKTDIKITFVILLLTVISGSYIITVTVPLDRDLYAIITKSYKGIAPTFPTKPTLRKTNR